jgi:glycosyltransferase involved in cell wall biosynthesis
MNAAVNGRFLCRQITGVERYGHEILRCMEVKPRVIQSNRWVRGAAGYAWEQVILPLNVRHDEILWSPANLGPLVVKNQVLTLHDLSPLENPGWFAPSFALWYRLLIPQLVQRVRQITVPSAYVQAKTVHMFHLRSDQVTVIQGGVDTERFHPGISPPEGLPNQYVLFVGSLQPRKNLGLLLQAWRDINQRFPEVWLLAAGETNDVFRKEHLPADLDRFRWLGYIGEHELPGLYAGAQALVLPSLDEGYGLPILEAMACGTTTIIARAGAMPEVAGDAALFFAPDRVDELADLIAICLCDNDLRCSMTEKGLAHARRFPWGRSARKLWEVMQQCH